MNESQITPERDSRISGHLACSAPAVHGARGRFSWIRSDRGATATEYAIMVSLIAVVIIGGVTLFGQNMIHLFEVPASAL